MQRRVRIRAFFIYLFDIYKTRNLIRSFLPHKLAVKTSLDEKQEISINKFTADAAIAPYTGCLLAFFEKIDIGFAGRTVTALVSFLS